MTAPIPQTSSVATPIDLDEARATAIAWAERCHHEIWGPFLAKPPSWLPAHIAPAAQWFEHVCTQVLQVLLADGVHSWAERTQALTQTFDKSLKAMPLARWCEIDPDISAVVQKQKQYAAAEREIAKMATLQKKFENQLLLESYHKTNYGNVVRQQINLCGVEIAKLLIQKATTDLKDQPEVRENHLSKVVQLMVSGWVSSAIHALEKSGTCVQYSGEEPMLRSLLPTAEETAHHTMLQIPQNFVRRGRGVRIKM